LGHTRIAYVGDSLEDEYGFTTSLDRYQGYRQALERHGLHIRPEYIRLGEHGRDVAQRMTAELLALPQPPTAIFAMSDLQAFGCISAVKNAGLRVPEDISVVGFDDLEISHYAGLTTINQHLQDSGRIAAECLLRLFNYERITPPELPPAELVIRQTTAAPL
jgi:LacI family transcriptional regulator